MNHLVLSGTTTHVLSGTRSSCYRGPKSGLRFWRSTSFRARNFTNLESFGFFLTDRAFFTAEDNRQSFAPSVITAALLNRVGFPEPRERGPKVRDWPLNRETISPNEETGFRPKR